MNIIRREIESGIVSPFYRLQNQATLLTLLDEGKEFPKRFNPIMDKEDVEKHILENNPSKWYSGCRSLDELKDAYYHSGNNNGNYELAAIIITEPTKTISAQNLASQLKCDSEVSNHKKENEVIPVEDISTKKILVIVDKNDKDDFFAGKKVKNLMANSLTGKPPV